MGSESALRLQKIDFSAEGLVPGSHRWELVLGQVREALETHGCFEAVYDGVPPEIREALFGSVKELFALPLETKQRNPREGAFEGYIGQLPGITYESLGLFDPNLPHGAQRFADLMWSEGNPEFCETVYGYGKKLAELDQIVRKMVMESYGLEKYYQSQMESTRYSLRLIQYEGSTQSEEAKLGLPPHVDPNIANIIYQNEIGGLEVQTKEGDWIPFDPSGPNSYFVMNGASFRAWTNGKMHAPVHQVKCNAGKKTRYSVLLTMVPKDDVVVEAPEELLEEGHPRLFRPYKYIDYHKYVLSPGRPPSADCHLTAYCGVQSPEA